MELYALSQAPGAKKRRKRVGCGPSSGHGKTSGRGHKGAKARSGTRRKRNFEGGQMPLIRRLPKRGFNHQKRYPLSVLNVDVLARYFKPGETVTVEVLRQKHLIKTVAGGVKILGRGDLPHPLTVCVQAVSPSAKEKIEKAGGTVTIVPIANADAETQE